jgi:hypothetical protein
MNVPKAAPPSPRLLLLTDTSGLDRFARDLADRLTTAAEGRWTVRTLEEEPPADPLGKGVPEVSPAILVALLGGTDPSGTLAAVNCCLAARAQGWTVVAFLARGLHASSTRRTLGKTCVPLHQDFADDREATLRFICRHLLGLLPGDSPFGTGTRWSTAETAAPGPPGASAPLAEREAAYVEATRAARLAAAGGDPLAARTHWERAARAADLLDDGAAAAEARSAAADLVSAAPPPAAPPGIVPAAESFDLVSLWEALPEVCRKTCAPPTPTGTTALDGVLPQAVAWLNAWAAELCHLQRTLNRLRAEGALHDPVSLDPSPASWQDDLLALLSRRLREERRALEEVRDMTRRRREEAAEACLRTRQELEASLRSFLSRIDAFEAFVASARDVPKGLAGGPEEAGSLLLLTRERLRDKPLPHDDTLLPDLFEEWWRGALQPPQARLPGLVRLEAIGPGRLGASRCGVYFHSALAAPAE